jgi:hypothetical protein
MNEWQKLQSICAFVMHCYMLWSVEAVAPETKVRSLCEGVRGVSHFYLIKKLFHKNVIGRLSWKQTVRDEAKKFPFDRLVSADEKSSLLFGTDPNRIGLLGKLPSSEAFVPLQEPVGELASYVPRVQMQVRSETSVVVHNLYFAQVTIMG